MTRLIRKLFNRIFCRPRTLAELRDCQPDWEGKLAVTSIVSVTGNVVKRGELG